ncbi:glycerol-3-phosphate ABC transporter permease [Natronococcus pandeyae]|uniref:Glycerol-3-phosphate ABC transporter permease n=1 Tax=Natronococcus pandeyae TaxID=2055836 RepID=A0A8J8TR50_9EURY|nr:carbohydrate ABC transporter permease [Natronococcus pandeyae]TYL37359.1 glycerol-3-phosphate ABC transporter permease [Natronococcus pandeyae]
MATSDKFDIDRAQQQSIDAWTAWKRDFLQHPGSHLALVLSSLVLFTPIALTLLLTTQTTAQVYDLNHLGPGGLATAYENYYHVLVEYGFWRLMLNSFFVAGVSTIGAITISLLAALALVFYDFPLKRLMFFFILLTLMVPFVIRVVPLYELVVSIGWHDTYWGLTVPFLASATGVFLFRQHFKSVPIELVETTQLDGVSSIAFLWKVLIPMTKGMIAGLSVILFISTWNAYFWPLIAINTEHRQVAQVGLQFLQSAQVGTLTAYNLMMTGAILSLLPSLALLIALRKYLLTTMGLKVN